MKSAPPWLVLAPLLLTAAIARGEEPKTLTAHFHSFLEMKWNLSPYETEEQLDAWTLTPDEKNGFIEASDGADLEGDMQHDTFAVWRSTGSGPAKVFGFTQGTEGCVSESSFWTYEKGKWRKLTGLVPIDLKDFWADGQLPPPGSQEYVALAFQLPRRGTTITVRLKPKCENGLTPTDLERFEALEAEAKYQVVKLAWDARAGRFVRSAREARPSRAPPARR